MVVELSVPTGRPNQGDDHRAATVDALVASIAEGAPDSVALHDGPRGVTYRELVDRAAVVSEWLRGRGVGPDAVVGVCATRGPELVTGCLGAWGTGAAYLPLDPEHPAQRRRALLADVGATALLTTTDLLADAPQGLPVLDLTGPAHRVAGAPERLLSPAGPSRAAYVVHTSGSTGTPKGVVVGHDSLLDLVRWHGREFGMTPSDRVALMAGVGFDASVWEIWGTLCAGASLVVPPARVRLSPSLLRDWLVAEQITTTFAPTVLAEQLLRQSWPTGTRLRLLLAGGERLRRRPSAGLPFTFVNLYGPTECTVVATSTVVTPGEGLPDIGLPRPGTRAMVLDPGFRAVPDGEAGELFLAGPGVAQKYLGRPAETARSFLPDPGGPPGSRMYRTGDLVRRGPEGRLEFLGRVDAQVKVSGHRIEPAEVEAALAGHPGVGAAVVRAREDDQGSVHLVAYVVAGPDGIPSVRELREHLRRLLPAPLLPRSVVVLDELPVTPNGKVDVRRLPEPDRAGALRGTPPRTSIERHVLEIWREVLGGGLGTAVDALGVDDPFEEAGGTSLTAAAAAVRITERFRVEVPLRSFFTGLTVAAIAEMIADAGTEHPTPEGEPAREADPDLGADRPGDRTEPVSSAQRRLWLLQAIAPDPALYTNVLLLDLQGPLDRSALRRALDELVQRHEALRSRVVEVAGRPEQVVAEPWQVELPETDLQDAPPERVRQLLEAETTRVFDLSSGRLLRASLLRTGHATWRLVLALHHAAVDGWSIGVLVRDLAAAYAGEPLPPLARRFADHARWETDRLAGAVGRRLRDFWTTTLAGVPETLALPTDHPRPRTPRFTGRTVTTELGTGLLRDAELLARAEQTTVFTTLLAGVATVLQRNTGQSDLLIAAPAANRPEAGFEQLVGCFVNTVPLRCDLSGRPTFRELLHRLSPVVLDAVQHQELPFEQILETTGAAVSGGARPLVPVMLAVQPPTPAARAGGLDVSFAGEVHGATARFELTVSLEQTDGRHALVLEYDDELFEPTTAQRLLGQLVTLLSAAVAAPGLPVDELPVLSPDERSRVLTLGRGERRPLAATTVPALVAENALTTPDAVAVECGDVRLTYAELTGAVNGLAWQLRDAGVRAGDPVAVCFERSAAPVVGLLAVLAVGGVYVPLDPAHPDQRLAEILEDLRPRVVLTGPSLGQRLAALVPGATVVSPDGRSCECPPPAGADPDPDAYAIYTSGSTGRPKGVLVGSTALLNLTVEKIRRFHLAPGSRALQYVPFGFGVSVADVCSALAAGATLVVRGPEVLAGAALAALLKERRVTHLVVPPSVLASVPDAGDLPDLQVVVVGGEPCPADLVARFAPGRLFVQAYGPTEATVCATTAECRPEPSRPPVGHPLANVDVFVLDDSLRPAAQGVVGEVCIGGIGLARGYLRQPELTAQRFVPHPFAGELAPPGARLYRTGDLGRFRADGLLELLGRMDDQVQLRGVRVEVTEVEAAVRAQTGVAEAAVRLHHHPVAGPRLVAYAVPCPGAELRPADLRARLRDRLPEVMVPAVVVLLPELPRTATGKLDRRALPEPPERDAGRRGPGSPAEEAVAQTWTELLGVEDLDVDDDFFLLGGQSLLAAQVAARLRDRFEIDLSARDVFEAPTLARLAARLEQAVLADLLAEAVPL